MNPQKYTLRNLMLDLCEVGERMNAFQYYADMLIGLNLNQITPKQFELLKGDLQLHCERNNIITKTDSFSIF